MRKPSTDAQNASRVTWEHLEEWVRRKVQALLQAILEEAVTEFLGRRKSQRRQAVDAAPGYRNGYGKARSLTWRCGACSLFVILCHEAPSHPGSRPRALSPFVELYCPVSSRPEADSEAA